MTHEELLREIEKLRKENDLLRSQLSGQVNKIVTRNADSRDGQLDGYYAENIEDIGNETSSVVAVSSESSNSSVSEQKKDGKSELRSKLFPWLKKGIPLSAESGISDRDYQYNNGGVGATTSKEDNNSQGEDLSDEKNSVNLSDFTIVDDDTEKENPEEEAVDINQFATINKKGSNSEEEDLSGYFFADDKEFGNEDLSGYFFADDEGFKNEEEDNKKRRFPFFGKKKEKIDYQPKHLRQTKKLERIRESKFFNKIKSAMNNKAVKVIAAVLIAPVAIGGMILAAKLSNDDNKNNSNSNLSYVMRDDSEVPSTTAANEFGVSATEVADSLDINNKDNDKKIESNSNSKENISSFTTSGSNEQNNNQEDNVQEYNVPESSNNEAEYVDDATKVASNEYGNNDNAQEVEESKATSDEAEYIDGATEVASNEYENNNNAQEIEGSKATGDEAEYNDNDLNTDYKIAADGYGVELDYNIGDDVHFDGTYLYKTSVDAANDTNRCNPLYPSTDERKISLIRLVSSDGRDKITIDANNKEKKEQLESQGWTAESYNIDNLTEGVKYEGWTSGKSLK